jgi:alpha-2-macroglobulin
MVRKLLPIVLLVTLCTATFAAVRPAAKEANLQISVSQRTFYIGTKVRAELSTYNLKAAQLAVYQVPLEALVPNAYAVTEEDITKVGSLPYLLKRLDLRRYNQERVWTAYIKDPSEDSWEEQNQTIEPLRPGIYVLTATGGGYEKRTWFAVSSRALIVKRSPYEILAWVTNAQTGQPGANVPLTLYGAKGKLTAAKTGADGLVKFNAPPLPQAAWVSATQGDPAFAQAEPPEDLAPYAAYLYTDRPIYRPGHLIRFRGTVRGYSGEGYSPVNDVKTVRTEIKTRGGSTVYDQVLPLNEWGTFAGEFQLAPEPPLGDYEIVTTVGTGDKETRFFHTFQVQSYRKPEFTVDVTIPKTHYLGGEGTIPVTISAKYFFGSPVSGGKVSYRVNFSRQSSPVPTRILTAAGLGSAAMAQIEDNYTDEGRLDKNGQLVINVKTRSLPFDRSLYVSAEVSETALRPQSGSASTSIAAAAWHLSVSTDKDEYQVGSKVTATITTRDYDDKPVSVPAHFSFIENLTDRENRAFQETTKREIETDAQGKATMEFVVKRPGEHRIEVWGQDSSGNAVFASTSLEVVKKLGEPSWPSLDLTRDKYQYQAGDTAQITLKTDKLGVWVLFTVEGERLYYSKVLRVTKHETEISLPIESAYEPNVSLRAAYVLKGDMTSANESLNVPPNYRRLQVIVTPNKERYQPAETASYTIVTRDAKGASVPAEVGLGVVDASIYEIRPDSTPDPFDAWWGTRATRVETAFSIANMYPGGAQQSVPPSPAAAPMMREAGKAGAPGAGNDAAPRVRNFFTDTAYWGPSVVTGPDGTANVQFTVPDNLTTWRATARALTQSTQAGEVRKNVIVTLPLLVRFTLPRFYVEGDEATVAATVHNYTGTDRTVKVSLTGEGAQLLEPAEKTLKLANDDLQRLTWRVKITGPKSVRFLVSADGGPGGKDATESTLPVYADGVKEVQAKSGMTATSEQTVLNLPPASVPGSGLVEVSLSPSLGGPIFDALEYLVNYPYGCAEQTMSSFLPNVIVADTLKRLGAQRPRPKNLDRYVSFGLQKLLRYQHSDGGWHWWEFDESDPFVTAYVVYGLKVADQAGYVGAHAAMVRGVSYLKKALDQETYRDARAYLLWALAFADVWDNDKDIYPAVNAAGRLFNQRAKLDLFSQASLAMACQKLARAHGTPAPQAAELEKDATTLANELEAQATKLGIGSYWAADGRYRYSWLDNNVEVTSQVLTALLTLKPDSPQILPAVRWLMTARDGKSWSSSKDTASAVLALTRYLEQSRDLSPDFTARLFCGDKLIREIKFTPEDALKDPVAIAISALDLKPGDNTLRLEKSGTGNLYWAARIMYLTPSDKVIPRTSDIELERKYRLPAEDPSLAGSQAPGNVVYVDVTIRTKQNLRYALLQEPIPAGCEFIDSGEDRLPEVGADRREVWDNKLLLYFDYLPRGERTFTYALRTESPGKFRILPTNAELMYYPEVRGYNKPVRMIVNDAPQ